MKTITYNKLIRDKIPEIIEQAGKKVIVEKMEDEQYLKMLNNKLNEELLEYQEDDNNIEELADLVEVVYAILDFKGVSLADFEKIRQDKVKSRGAFKERLLLKEVIKE